MSNWLKNINQLLKQNDDFVMLTVLKTKGSSPCVAGDKMFVDSQKTLGSIGGGNLEYQALKEAKAILASAKITNLKKTYPLGASLGQCCGGAVVILLTRFCLKDKAKRCLWQQQFANIIAQWQDFVIIYPLTNNSETALLYVNSVDFFDSKQTLDKQQAENLKQKADNLLAQKKVTPINQHSYDLNDDFIFELCCLSKRPMVAIFGAGHIGRALMPVLTQLPLALYWIDDRESEFNLYDGDLSGIRVICDDFVAAIDQLPANVYALVISYSHQIDFEICEKMLLKDDFSYLGLIGSDTKGKRFEQRLLQKGLSQTQINKLICPIGKKQKGLKSPVAVSTSITMELLQWLENKMVAA